jgi:hypothetical protein
MKAQMTKQAALQAIQARQDIPAQQQAIFKRQSERSARYEERQRQKQAATNIQRIVRGNQAKLRQH